MEIIIKVDGCKRLNYRFGYEIIKQNRSLDHKDYQLNSLCDQSIKDQSIYEVLDLLVIITNTMWLLFFNNSQRTGDNQRNFTSEVTDCYFLVVNNQKKSFYMNVDHYCYAENTA